MCRRGAAVVILVPGIFSAIFFYDRTTSRPTKQPKPSKWSVPEFKSENWVNVRSPFFLGESVVHSVLGWAQGLFWVLAFFLQVEASCYYRRHGHGSTLFAWWERLRKGLRLCHIFNRVILLPSHSYSWHQWWGFDFICFYYWKQQFRTLAWESIISNPYGLASEFSGFCQNRTGDLWITFFSHERRALTNWAKATDKSRKTFKNPCHWSEWRLQIFFGTTHGCFASPSHELTVAQRWLAFFLWFWNPNSLPKNHSGWMTEFCEIYCFQLSHCMYPNTPTWDACVITRYFCAGTAVNVSMIGKPSINSFKKPKSESLTTMFETCSVRFSRIICLCHSKAGGVLWCHGQIIKVSHLVRLKTLIYETPKHPKKWPKNLTNTFCIASISQCTFFCWRHLPWDNFGSRR